MPATEPTLTAVLSSLGYVHTPQPSIFGALGTHDIVRESTGEVVYEGSAYETWSWLRATGQHPTTI